MATVAENIQARKAAIWAEIAAGANSKPTYTSGGRTVDWNEYKAGLYAELAAIDKALQQEGGPFIVKQIMG